MNAVINCMLERRSIRKYKPEQITDDKLNIILEAGLYAPNAGGRQGPIVVVCQNEAVNQQLGIINKSAYKGRISTQNAFISKGQPSIADDTTIQSGFYGAPTVLTLFAPRNFLYSEADCCVMAENIMLAAHSLGIGSCMVMRAQETFVSDFGRQLQKDWGIDDSMEAKAHITMGYPAGSPAIAKPRKENRVIRI